MIFIVKRKPLAMPVEGLASSYGRQKNLQGDKAGSQTAKKLTPGGNNE